MKASFKTECFRVHRLGTILDPWKGSNYYYVKILFSVVVEIQNIDNQNIRITWSSPGYIRTFYTILHGPFYKVI